MTPLPELLRNLVAINSINPTLAGGPGEGEIGRWLHGWFEALGLPSQLQSVVPGRPNVIARVRGRGEAPPLLLNAHVDTVGVEGMPDPFTLRADGDKLFGRGTYDMKGSAAIMLGLAEAFVASPPPGDLWLTLVCDEEDVSLGMEALIRDWLPTLDTPPAAALVLEPTEEGIGIAHKGFAWCEVTVTGWAAHGSRPDEGRDAIMPLGAALGELARLEAEFDAGPRHPLLGRPSLHASTIQGGSAWSVYPASATLRWERRTLPHEDAETVAGELNRVLDATRGGKGIEASGTVVFGREPLGTPAESALIQAFQQAAPDASLCGLSFWTDGALLSAVGIPTVIYGPIGHGAHAVDEWVSAASLERVAGVVRAVIESAGRWAG